MNEWASDGASKSRGIDNHVGIYVEEVARTENTREIAKSAICKSMYKSC